MPVHYHMRVVQSLVAWVCFITFWHDGEPYDYMFEVGSVMMSEPSALALVKRNGYEAKSREYFLREVNLGTMH